MRASPALATRALRRGSSSSLTDRADLSQIQVSALALSQQHRPTLETSAIRLANLPRRMQGQDAKPGNPLVIGVVRNERNTKPYRACGRPRSRPLDRLAEAEPH